MNVGELRELIKNIPDDVEVLGTCTMDAGRGSNSCGEGDVSVDFYNKDEEYEYIIMDSDEDDEDIDENGNKTVTHNNVLVISVSGEETSYD